MADNEVTAPEIARRLGVDPKRFRNWLRALKEDHDPIVASHEKHKHYRFSESEAHDLQQRWARH